MKYIILVLIAISFLNNSCKTDSDKIEKKDSATLNKWIDVKSNNLASNVINSIAIDGAGNKWFGTTKGLSMYNGSGWVTYKREISDSASIVNSLAYKNSELWIGTEKGISVIRFNTANQIDTIINYFSTSITGAISDLINGVYVDNSNIKYFLTDQGLSFYGQSWHKITGRSVLDNRGYITASFSTSGNNYTSFQSGGMLKFKYNEVDGVTGASVWEAPYNGIITETVQSIYTSSTGELWLG